MERYDDDGLWLCFSFTIIITEAPRKMDHMGSDGMSNMIFFYLIFTWVFCLVRWDRANEVSDYTCPIIAPDYW